MQNNILKKRSFTSAETFQNNSDSITQPDSKKKLLVVLPAPPFPLNQGYRHAAYNDIIQLSKLRDLHLLICNGKEWVYDFDPNSYENNFRELKSIPGVKSVTFIEPKVEWNKSLRERFLHSLSNFFFNGRLIEDYFAKEMTERIYEFCRKYEINEIHFGITINLFLDCFLNLRETGSYEMSFTAHDIDADKILIRLKENLSKKNFLNVLTNLMAYWILLRKEIKVCRMSRFVIAMSYHDYERLASKNVQVYFIPPYLHAIKIKSQLKELPHKPSLVVLGHLAFSAAGHGVELFLDKVAVKVKEKVPDAEIKIIGKDADAGVILKCAQLGIKYQEYVEDPEELWNQISVLASPLLVSKGIRIRILEAAYRGIPVVCTRQSVTGFYQPEDFLNVTNNFDSFADRCIELLSDNIFYKNEQQRILNYFNNYLSEEITILKWKKIWQTNFKYSTSIPHVKGPLKKLLSLRYRHAD